MKIIRYKFVNLRNKNTIKVDCEIGNLVQAEKTLFDAAKSFGMNDKEASEIARQESVWVVPGNVTKNAYMRILYASPLVMYVRKV